MASGGRRSMFAEGFNERRDLEQYFWTPSTVSRIVAAVSGDGSEYQGHICCLTTPTLAHSLYSDQHQTELLLDIDTRFNYLPGFRYFDLRTPTSSAFAGWPTSRIIVFDPPFFYIPLTLLYQAVLEITGGNPNTKLMVGFLKREEAALLKTFAAFKLRPTKFLLEYQTVKPNKWTNYTLYSNVDLLGIKRMK